MTYTQPFFAVFLVGTLIGVLLGKRNPASRFTAVFAITLLLFSWPPVALLAAWLYERPFSSDPPRDQDVQAIVVLSSTVFPPAPPRPTAILGADTYERCQYAAWLYRHWRLVPVLASGGGSRGGVAYSVTMAEALQREGVPSGMILAEERSRSTYENAVYSAGILRGKGIKKIALVTDAYHMKRAEKCFRKQGIDVVPAACGFRANFRWGLKQTLPGWEAISWNEDTLHESVGLLWYGLRGWI